MYKVEARLGRVTLTGYTTRAMHALLVAGQQVGRNFVEEFCWEEFLRSTVWEDQAWWAGHGASTASGWQKAGPVTTDHAIRAV